MTESIAPKSDQANAEDFLSGPRTFTIERVRKGGGDDQPFDFYLADFPRPFRPSKTVRRLIVAAWGKDADQYAGRRLTLYRDPEVRWAGQEIGGIRVSHMSHLTKPLTLALTETRGKRTKHTVHPLPDDVPASAPIPDYMPDARKAKTLDEWRQVWQRASDAGHLTPELKAELLPIGEALKTPAAGDEADYVEEPPPGWEPDNGQAGAR